ncbi:MAG: hypothetical protein LBL44_00205 [Treponema sp.]|jgi:hypothetical protein|nr:hypothetical protein [Treponema sp.]
MFSFENLDVLRLNLRAPLFYIKDEKLSPFVRPSDRQKRPFPCETEEDGVCGEYIFRFEIEEDRGNVIDPDPAGYLGSPLFSGRRAEDRDTASGRAETCFELSAGTYFFAQAREALDLEECTLMAIEVQREILWQRLPPRRVLYVRRLFEHGKPVTQAWRTFTVQAKPFL